MLTHLLVEHGWGPVDEYHWPDPAVWHAVVHYWRTADHHHPELPLVELREGTLLNSRGHLEDQLDRLQRQPFTGPPPPRLRPRLLGEAEKAARNEVLARDAAARRGVPAPDPPAAHDERGSTS